jgi:hypothetical protein
MTIFVADGEKKDIYLVFFRALREQDVYVILPELLEYAAPYAAAVDLHRRAPEIVIARRWIVLEWPMLWRLRLRRRLRKLRPGGSGLGDVVGVDRHARNLRRHN